MKIEKAIFYMDSPVSNTGKLKQKILEIYKKFNFDVEVNLVPNADVLLEKLDNVVTTDGIILNKCSTWINMAYNIAQKYIDEFSFIDLYV